MTPLTKLRDRFSETEIDDEVIVMRLDTGEMLSMTGTGTAIWRLIDGTRNREQLLSALSEQFETNLAVESDVDDFLARLRSAGLLAPA